MKCKVDGCEGNVRTKGFCDKHYQQFRRNGDPLHKENKKLLKKICAVDGCDRTVSAKGFCGKHYQKLHEHGDPTYSARDPRGVATRHPLYRLWAGIRQRCFNEECDSYPNYGGRGITICAEWEDFWQFIDDMGERPSAHHSVDRISSDGNYEPSNCKWSTPKEQSWNKRNTVLPEGHRRILSERRGIGRFNIRNFCKENGINVGGARRFLSGQNYAPDTIDHAAVAPAAKVDFGLLALRSPLLGVCSIDGCGEEHYARDLCSKHYARLTASSTLSGTDISVTRHCQNCNAKIPDHYRPDSLFCDVSCKLKFHRREGCYTQEAQLASRGACAVPGCGKPQHAQRVCRSHYMKAWHEGKDVDIDALIAADSAKIKCEGCETQFKPEKRNQQFCTSKCYFRNYRQAHPRQ